MSAAARLDEIATELKNGNAVEPIAVRTLLDWFGVERRGRHRVWSIRYELEKAGLVTRPDFAGAFINGTIRFELKPMPTSPVGAPQAIQGFGTITVAAPQVSASSTAEPTELLSGATADPTYRISRLESANRTPVSVTPDTPLREVVTLMLMHDFSQLPIMQGDYVVKGAVSWRSIGKRLALNTGGATAKEFAEDVRTIASINSIFVAIPLIVQNDFVLVRGEHNDIVGILTTSDLSEQLRTLTEPFLLLNEIENHLRRLLADRFTLAEVSAALQEGDEAPPIGSVFDLTIGQYIQLVDHQDRWPKIRLPIDRVVFMKQLHRVREIRNDVMHFDPEGVGNEELDTLRKFVRFLQEWHTISESQGV